MQKEDSRLPHINDFILYLINNNYSNHTVDNYRRDLEIFDIFLKSKKIKFEDISKLLINEYKGYLRTGQHLLDIDRLEKKKSKKTKDISEIAETEPESSDTIVNIKISSSKGSRNGKSKSSGLNGQSVNRMLSSLRTFLSFLDDIDQEIPISPNAIKLVKTEKKEKQVADFDEIVELIESPEIFETKRKIKYRNRAILELLFSTGMRISEVVSLDIGSMKTDPDRNHILDSKLYIMGKGKKQRFVYLTERCISFLERYLQNRKDDYPALFIPYRGQRKESIDDAMVRISSRYIQSMIKKYKEKLGIVVPTTPHSLRHGFATYLAEKGANPAAIQRLLGHESLQTTTRYVHASDNFAEKSHQSYHPLQEK